MIDIVTSFMMFASVLYGQTSTGPAVPTSVPAEQKPKTTEEIVRNYFAETPILIEVARCESTFRQTTSNGEVLRGNHNEYDVGVMQINELYHLDKSKELGLDIHTIEGNMAYAKWLYEREDLAPWKSSSKCWKPKPAKELTRA